MAHGKIRVNTLTYDTGSGDVDVAVSTIPNASALAAKADLASPTFTGTPAAPTATQGTNSNQLATTAYVQAEVGQTIQAHDADTAKIDVAQTYTAAQRGQKVTASGTSFTLDLNAANNFQISPSGTYTVALSNLATAAVGQTGSIFITPSAAAASGSFPTTMKFVGGAAGITLTGTSGSIDRIDYIVMDNTTVTCNFTANYVQ